jgi:hypothetical protein
MNTAANPALTATPCSLESLDSHEPLLGTAPRADVWFALEYPGRWGDKAWAESTVDATVKEHVDAQVKRIPEARWMLIKQRTKHERIRFFAAVVAPEPALYAFELVDYTDLLGLDLAAIVAGDPAYASARSEEPVFLVCTNGHRDQCCALHGIAAYGAIHSHFGDVVWESTHHGGHRFAANLLALPAGLSLGRLRADNAVELVQTLLDGRIPLDHYRGNTAWPEPLQAAETLLRRQLNLDAAGSVQLLASQPAGDNRWQATFAAAGGEHRVVIERSAGAPVHLSCGDEKTTPIAEYKLVRG